VYYKDQDTGFSAYYPEDWERNVIPPEPNDPGRAVVFIAPSESTGTEGNAMISVSSLPALDFLGSTYPDVEED
jgi:predicted RNase H-like HicB family nuclease